MKRISIFLLIAVFLPVLVVAQSKGISRANSATASTSRQRVALVIGNAAYESSPLRNPVNDAEAVGLTLRDLGFQVTTLKNASQQDMEVAMDEFGKKLRDGGVGLFYYSGHGIQVEGENYLVPVDASISTESAVRYKAVPAGLMLAQMKDAGNDMNIVILDACRNNPFKRSFRSAQQGLAQMDAPKGTFISYATAPGSVAADGEGNNGLYTSKLIQHLREPGLKIEEVFKQVRADVQRESNEKQTPWESSSLVGDFYFAGEPVAMASPEDGPRFSLDELTAELDEAPQVEAPQGGGFSLGDLTATADHVERTLRVMKQALLKVEAYEKEDHSATRKLEAWQLFQSTFQEDLEGTDEDQDMQQKANRRIAQWKDVKEKQEWEPRQVAMSGAYAQVTAFEQRNVGDDLKLLAWQRFADAFPDDNPFSREDDRMREQAANRLKTKNFDRYFDPTTGMEFVGVPGTNFFMGVREVSQREWVKVMGSNPAYNQSSEDNPVEQISYTDAETFVAKLNQLDPKGDYRIPSLWEWFAACDTLSKTGIASLSGGIREWTTQPYGSSFMTARQCKREYGGEGYHPDRIKGDTRVGLRLVRQWPRKRAGWLGVETQSITKELAVSLRIEGFRQWVGRDTSQIDGALVVSVARNSPALKAGLQRADAIRSISGQFVISPSSLDSQIRKHGAGAPVELLVTRNGKNQTINVVLAEAPVGSE
jgi:uncharacterized caspase-like protein